MTELVYLLVTTHITIVSVTLYLHRSQAHRSVEFHPWLDHFFRAWLWLTTGMQTKEWVAVHRKHHRLTDQPGDPHSPHVYGLWRVLTQGALLYHQASRNSEMIQAYGRGTPDDHLERRFYSRYPYLGVLVLLLADLLIFGWPGALIWVLQMIWIPFWAAGVINGIGHYWGYRNGQTRDHSRNIVPWGIVVGGEELHNNHHLDPHSPRLSRQWWEVDLGWWYIKILKLVGLAKVDEYWKIK